MTKEHTLTTTVKRSKASKNISGVLRTPGWLAEWPIIGVVMVVLGGLMFGALAYNLETQGPLLQWDMRLAEMVRSTAADRPSRVNELLLFGFFVGKEFVQVIAILMIIYFLHKRFWRELAMVVVGMGGGAIIWYFLIRVFERHRPDGQMGLVVTDPSFPSGHAITSVLCYGLLAYMLVPKMPSKFWKWFVIVLTVLVMVFIGLSRLLVNGHYLTDLLAGYALGLAWAGLVYTTLEKTVD